MSTMATAHNIAQILSATPAREKNDRLAACIQTAKEGLANMLQRGYTRWLIMYSGGKDSTAAFILADRFRKACNNPDLQLELCYTDTSLEIPTLHAHANAFLEAMEQRGVVVRRFVPAVEDSYWVQVIGKGYPPPRQHFRWCTSRLKIKPVERYLATLPETERRSTLVITGVRFRESDARDKRLNLSCSRGGECGQGVWFEKSHRWGIGYFSPIAAWRECDVWDFLLLLARSWGYPVADLESVYDGRSARFGCWTCTVVQQDKTMTRLCARAPQYLPYLRFRNWLASFCQDSGNRVRRSNGTIGRLTLVARKEILQRLQSLETELGTRILTESECHWIEHFWNHPKYGDIYF